MYKTDKRLTKNHLTEEEFSNRLKETENLPDVSDKAEGIDMDLKEAGLLERINARKAARQKNNETKIEENS